MLQEILNFVNGNLAASATMAGLMLEMILRLVPSEQPQSILLAVSKAIHLVADIASGLAKFLDKVIPQKLK